MNTGPEYTGKADFYLNKQRMIHSDKWDQPQTMQVM